jgi:murein DD-endopeptidase MepM/ murein hydrolase activator NlpD
MASQTEELQIRINLVDNASAGIARLRGEMQQLVTGSAAANVEKLKRSQDDLARQIRQVTSLALGGEKAMLSFIGKFGVAGAVISGFGLILGATLRSLTEFATRFERLSIAAKKFGVDTAEVKAITEQLEQLGLAAEDGIQLVADQAKAHNQLREVDSSIHQQLMNLAGSHKAEMQKTIDAYIATADPIKQTKILTEAGNEIHRRSLIAHKGDQEAANQDTNDFYEIFSHVLVEMRARGFKGFNPVTEAQRQAIKNRKDATEGFLGLWRQIQADIRQWMGDIKASPLAKGGFLYNGLELSLEAVQQIRVILKDPPAWLKDVQSLAESLNWLTGAGQGKAAEPKGGAAPQGGQSLSEQLGINSIPGSEGEPGAAMRSMRPQGIMGGEGGNEWWSQFPRSKNIIDLRNVVDSANDPLEENTKVLKELNDMLFRILNPEAGGGGGGGAGGGGGGGGGGGDGNGKDSASPPTTPTTSPSKPFMKPEPGALGPKAEPPEVSPVIDTGDRSSIKPSGSMVGPTPAASSYDPDTGTTRGPTTLQTPGAQPGPTRERAEQRRAELLTGRSETETARQNRNRVLEQHEQQRQTLREAQGARDVAEGQKGYFYPVTGYLSEHGHLGSRRRREGGGFRPHAGNDYLAPAGTPVYAARAGTVVEVAMHTGYGPGEVVVIRGEDGRYYRYAHLDGKHRVKVGDKITGGQHIGQVGYLASGSHLHFEIREENIYPSEKGKKYDPEQIFGLKPGQRLEGGKPIGPGDDRKTVDRATPGARKDADVKAEAEVTVQQPSKPTKKGGNTALRHKRLDRRTTMEPTGKSTPPTHGPVGDADSHPGM